MRARLATMNVLLLSQDLLFTPRLEAACGRCGAELVAVRAADALAQAPEAGAAILDLAMPGSEPERLVASLRARGVAAIAAYGSHVQQALLERARAAGCDLVLTRGQLHVQCDQVVEQLVELVSARS